MSGWNPRVLTSYSDPAVSDGIMVYHHADPDSTEIEIKATDYDPGKHALVKDLRVGPEAEGGAEAQPEPEAERRTPTRAGQMVQWESGGVDQFTGAREATRVKQGFVFFEDSETGIPAKECYVVAPEDKGTE